MAKSLQPDLERTMTYVRTAYDREHERELAKHEPRPGDLPHRLDVDIPTAVEIAAIVKKANLLDGANLIEQYAKAVASGAAADATRAAARIFDNALAGLER